MIDPEKHLSGSVGSLQEDYPFVETIVVPEEVFPSIFSQYPVIVEFNGLPRQSSLIPSVSYLHNLIPLSLPYEGAGGLMSPITAVALHVDEFHSFHKLITRPTAGA